MRIGALGRGVTDSRWRSMALIDRSSSRTLGRSPLARTSPACGVGEVLGDLLLLAEGGADGRSVLRVERDGGGLPDSAGDGAG